MSKCGMAFLQIHWYVCNKIQQLTGTKLNTMSQQCEYSLVKASGCRTEVCLTLSLSSFKCLTRICPKRQVKPHLKSVKLESLTKTRFSFSSTAVYLSSSLPPLTSGHIWSLWVTECPTAPTYGLHPGAVQDSWPSGAAGLRLGRRDGSCLTWSIDDWHTTQVRTEHVWERCTDVLHRSHRTFWFNTFHPPEFMWYYIFWHWKHLAAINQTQKAGFSLIKIKCNCNNFIFKSHLT